MDLLSGTPYLLDEGSGPAAMHQAESLQDRIALLRKKGPLDEPIRARLQSEWRLQQVYESAGIEGNSLTLTETQMAIQRGITISGKPPRHSEEVRDLNTALDYLENLATNATPLTEWEIRELQKLIVGSSDPHGGAYRTIEVKITNSPHSPPHPLKVPQEMSGLGEWLQAASALPPILHAAIAHTWLVYIHPFTDGNGRTGRAVLNLILIRAGYPPVIIRRKDRQRYYEALRASDQGDITPIIELILDRCMDSLIQIDRVRHAETGVSLAVQKLQEQELRKYEIWCDAIRLFRSTLDDQISRITADDAEFVVSTFGYDLPTMTDFRHLTQRDASGNTWLFKLKVMRRGTGGELLLWIGYSSHELERELRLASSIPAVKVSVTNPTPPPRYTLPQQGYLPLAREFAYESGRFHRLDEAGGGYHLRSYDNLSALTAEFVEDLVRAWWSGA